MAENLVSAVRARDVVRVRRALAEGANPNQSKEFPLLQRACRRPKSERPEPVDVVIALVEGGADVRATDVDGWSALTQADADDYSEIVAYLLSVGAEPKTQLAHGFTDLHRAVRRGDASECSRLLRSGVDVNETDALGSTALLHACRHHCDNDLAEELIRVLLHHQADPNIVSIDGSTALCSAAYEDSSHAADARPIRVPLLLAALADPNLGDYPPLFNALAQESVGWDVLDLLLRAGANPNTVNSFGETLIHRCAMRWNSDVIVRCLAIVDDPMKLDADGRTGLDCCLDDPSDDSALVAFLCAGIVVPALPEFDESGEPDDDLTFGSTLVEAAKRMADEGWTRVDAFLDAGLENEAIASIAVKGAERLVELRIAYREAKRTYRTA